MNFIAQVETSITSTTVPGEVEVVGPSRPISNWLIDVFDLEPDGSVAEVLSWIVEPMFQIVATVFIAWLVLRVVRYVARRLVNRARLAVDTIV